MPYFCSGYELFIIIKGDVFIYAEYMTRFRDENNKDVDLQLSVKTETPHEGKRNENQYYEIEVFGSGVILEM